MYYETIMLTAKAFAETRPDISDYKDDIPGYHHAYWQWTKTRDRLILKLSLANWEIRSAFNSKEFRESCLV